MRVAAYVRVSTPRQVKLQTIERQLQTIHRHAQDKGWELPEEDLFRDDGYSGASLDRPALDALRDKVRIRELDAVVVLSPDRVARNGRSTRWSSSRSSRRAAVGWSSSSGR
jgi:site-specific DNA recombinase